MPSQPTSSLFSDDSAELELELLAELAELDSAAEALAALLSEELLDALFAAAGGADSAPLVLGPPNPSNDAAPNVMAMIVATHVIPMAMLRGERRFPMFACAGM